MVGRTGHSLAELLVVTVVLSVGIGGAASAVAAGVRWSSRSDLRQRALSSARGVLDSLDAHPPPLSGAAADGELELRWEVTGAGRSLWRVEVVAERRGGAELLRLAALLGPRLPTLTGPAGQSAEAAGAAP